MKEWFSASELAGLPGLPGTERRMRDALNRLSEGKPELRRKREFGKGYEYRFASLPYAAQAALLERLAPPQTSIGCKDCWHYHAGQGKPGFCDSPQLQPFLDGDQCGMTHADAVRDLKDLCGFKARWFRPRDEQATDHGAFGGGANNGQRVDAQAPQPSFPEQSSGDRRIASTAREPLADSQCSVILKVTVTVEPVTEQGIDRVSTGIGAPSDV